MAVCYGKHCLATFSRHMHYSYKLIRRMQW